VRHSCLLVNICIDQTKLLKNMTVKNGQENTLPWNVSQLNDLQKQEFD